MDADRLLAAARAACGPRHVRPAGSGDWVDGVPAAVVATPPDADAASALLAAADRLGAAVGIRGGGSKLGWGRPPERVDLLVDTTALAGVRWHAAADLVARVGAGTRLADLQRHLAGAGQRLALDPPEHAATVGGIVAAGAAGPLRHRFGAARDLVIGTTVVLADGTTATSGGQVVKNVAGYDLGKLFTGSLGTLGLLTEITVRLHPRPAAARYVSLRVSDPPDAQELVQELLAARWAPSALELAWPGGLIACFEGEPAATEAQAVAATALRPKAAAAELPPEPYGQRPWLPGELGIKLAVPPGALAGALTALDRAFPRARARGPAGVGVVYAAAGPGADPAAALADLRTGLAEFDGTAVVLAAPPAVKARLDVWGPIRGLELMRRVKAEFDPGRRLAPGRFVGGI